MSGDTWPGRTRMSLRLDVQNSIFSSVQRATLPSLALAAAATPPSPLPAAPQSRIEEMQRIPGAGFDVFPAATLVVSSDGGSLAVASAAALPLSPQHGNPPVRDALPNSDMVLEDAFEDPGDSAHARHVINIGDSRSLILAPRFGSLPGTPASELFDGSTPARERPANSPVDLCNTSTSSDSSAKSSQSLLSTSLSTPSSTASSGSRMRSAVSALSDDSQSHALQTPRMFAFDSVNDHPSSPAPPTARKLAFGDVVAVQTAIEIVSVASAWSATTLGAPPLVRDLSHANAIAACAIEDEEWNTLLESAAVNLPVKYVLDQQWLREISDNTWFQIISMFFFLALAGAIGIGAAYSVFGALACTVVMIPLLVLTMTKFDRTMFPRLLASFNAVWMCFWFFIWFVCTLAAIPTTYTFRFESTHSVLEFGLGHVITTFSVVVLFAIVVAHDSFATMTRTFRVGCVAIFLVAALLDWIYERFVFTGMPPAFAFCVDSRQMVCFNATRLRLDAWFCMCCFLIRNMSIMLVYPDQRFMSIKSLIRLRVRVEPDADAAADDATAADANSTAIPSAALEFVSTAVTADWTAVSPSTPRVHGESSEADSPSASAVPGASMPTMSALTRASSPSIANSGAPCLLIRSNITKEIGRSTLYHEPLLTAPCAHRFRVVERLRALVERSSRAREAVFYVLTILFGFLFITAGPWISRPLPKPLIYTDIAIISVGFVILLSRIDWPLLRHLFRTFEFGFVACLCMGSLLVNVYQVLVDTSHRVAGGNGSQLYGVAAIQQVATGLLTFAMISVDALVVSPRVKMATIFCWFVFAVAEVAAQTGVLAPLPAHTQLLRVCMRTECFSLLTLRVQLKLTIAIFAVKYFYLLWQQPHTLAVIRASVSYEVEERVPSRPVSASISPARVEV